MLRKKWTVLAGLMTIVLAVVGLTVVPAMADSEDAEKPEKGARCQAYQEKVAEHLGVVIEDLQSAIIAAKTDIVNEALADGKITQEQADKILERLAENGACARIMPRFHHPGQGHGPMKGHAPGKTLNKAVEEGVITQAQADEVNAVFEQIKTYIEENGKPEVGLGEGDKLDWAVEQGIITQGQADTIESVMETIKAYAEENGLHRGTKGHGEGPMGSEGTGFSGGFGQMGMNGFGA